MISTVLFDMNDVLCRYNREVRVARLTRAYLSGFAARLGGILTLAAWVDALLGRADAAPGSLGPRGRGRPAWRSAGGGAVR
jgi:hypothetical protein